MNFVRGLAGAALVALALSGCVRLDLQATLTDHNTADGTLVVAMADNVAGMFDGDPADVWAQHKDQMVGDVPDIVAEEPYAEDGYTGSRSGEADPAVGPDPTAEATAEATPSPEPSPTEGVISEWGTPISLATFLVLVVGGIVAYMVSRRQRTAD